MDIDALEREVGNMTIARFIVLFFFSLAVFFLFAGIPGITEINSEAVLAIVGYNFQVVILTISLWAIGGMFLFFAIDVQTKINTLRMYKGDSVGSRA
jgi:hypothetical protein